MVSEDGGGDEVVVFGHGDLGGSGGQLDLLTHKDVLLQNIHGELLKKAQFKINKKQRHISEFMVQYWRTGIFQK